MLTRSSFSPRSSGVIKKIIDESTGINVEVEQNYGYYEAFSNSEFPKDMTVDTSTYNVKGNGMCIPGYTDSEGNEMPWLLGSADQWQNGGEHTKYLFLAIQFSNPTLHNMYYLLSLTSRSLHFSNG